MSYVRATIYLRESPAAEAFNNATDDKPASHYWVDLDEVTIHCRSEAQAALLAYAINLPGETIHPEDGRPMDKPDDALAEIAAEGEAAREDEFNAPHPDDDA